MWRFIQDLISFHDPGSIVRRAHLVKALGRLDGARVARVLDAGCGGGRHALLLARRWPRAFVQGVDIDAAAVSRATRRARRERRKGVRFLAGTLEKKDLAGEVDVAVCVDVLEHIADDRGALERLAASVREGGALLIHSPVRRQRRYFGVTAGHKGHLGGENFGHVRDGYTDEEIYDRLLVAGFRVAKMWPTFGTFAAAVSDLDYRLARAKLHPARVATYVLALIAARRETDHAPGRGRGVMVFARRCASSDFGAAVEDCREAWPAGFTGWRPDFAPQGG